MIRRLVGKYLSPFFQFHALWHLLTGYATYCLAVFVPMVDQFDPESLSGARMPERYAIGFNRVGLPITVFAQPTKAAKQASGSSKD